MLTNANYQYVRWMQTVPILLEVMSVNVFHDMLATGKTARLLTTVRTINPVRRMPHVLVTFVYLTDLVVSVLTVRLVTL